MHGLQQLQINVSTDDRCFAKCQRISEIKILYQE